MKNPVKQGVRSREEDGDTTSWWLFSPKLTKEEVKEFLDSNEIRRCYRGSGLFFTDYPCVRHSNSYTLITQFSGYDV